MRRSGRGGSAQVEAARARPGLRGGGLQSSPWHRPMSIHEPGCWRNSCDVNDHAGVRPRAGGPPGPGGGARRPSWSTVFCRRRPRSRTPSRPSACPTARSAASPPPTAPRGAWTTPVADGDVLRVGGRRTRRSRHAPASPATPTWAPWPASCAPWASTPPGIRPPRRGRAGPPRPERGPHRAERQPGSPEAPHLLRAMLIRDDEPDAQLAAVARRYGLADRALPFARCPRCNGEVAPVPKAEVADRIPPEDRPLAGRVLRLRRMRPAVLGRHPRRGTAGAPGTHPGRDAVTINETCNICNQLFDNNFQQTNPPGNAAPLAPPPPSTLCWPPPGRPPQPRTRTRWP